MITFDRELGCGFRQNWVTFIGSDFYEQGKRAAQAMIEATDGKGKVGILLGTSGNNVTTNRTAGFVDEVQRSAPNTDIVAQQTAEFAHDKEQSRGSGAFLIVVVVLQTLLNRTQRLETQCGP